MVEVGGGCRFPFLHTAQDPLLGHQCSFQGCQHLSTFTEWCTSQGLTEELAPQVVGSDDSASQTAVSSKSIPYPLTEQLKSTHDQIEAGQIQFPLCLVPPLDDKAVCPHGNR